jgi:hypothetical protein
MPVILMNLRRGLLRAWIAGSATWIVAVLIYYHLEDCEFTAFRNPFAYFDLNALICDPEGRLSSQFFVSWHDLLGLIIGVPLLAR